MLAARQETERIFSLLSGSIKRKALMMLTGSCLINASDEHPHLNYTHSVLSQHCYRLFIVYSKYKWTAKGNLTFEECIYYESQGQKMKTKAEQKSKLEERETRQ